MPEGEHRREDRHDEGHRGEGRALREHRREDHHQVVVIGGGTAGLTVAARLRRAKRPPDVAVIEPSETHYYQPLWTLVGAGVFRREASARSMADYIPRDVTWIRDAATAVDPDTATVTTEDDRTVRYDYLVVAPGLQLDWDAVPGLAESVGRPDTGVVSVYSYEHAPVTWQVMQGLGPGDRALFTQPGTPIKCGGAPQKIMYLTADHLRRRGILKDVAVEFHSPGSVVFGVEAFQRTLLEVIDRYGIEVHLQEELVEIRPDAGEAVFRAVGGDGATSRKTVPFDMLHVAPPQSAPDFVERSPLANEQGWVDAHRDTLQHVRYENVFALGDAAGTPNAKTGAAVRKQAPVVVHNLLQHMHHGALTEPRQYNGYSSCPLLTGYRRLVMAEFDYDNRPDPSFPFDTTKERFSMYLLKAYGLPRLYWYGMLKGRA